MYTATLHWAICAKGGIGRGDGNGDSPAKP